MKIILFKCFVSVCFGLSLSVFCFAQIKETDSRPQQQQQQPGKAKNDRSGQLAIFTLAPNGDILYGTEKVSAGKVTGQVSRLMEAKSAGQKIVYVEARADKNYGDVVDFIRLARRARVDDFGLLVREEAERNISTAVFVKAAAESGSSAVKANPDQLHLLVELSGDRRVSLNGKAMTLEDFDAELRRIFEERKQKRIFRDGSRQAETKVFVKAVPASKFGEVMKVIKTVKNAGAYPIMLDVDEMPKS